MICPDCGHDNIDGVDACEECGQSLVQFDPSGTELERAIAKKSVRKLSPKDPIMVDATTTVAEAMKAMREYRIGCLLVQSDGELVGIFTERDLLNTVPHSEDVLEGPVSGLMTKNVETITADDSIAYALHAMDLGGYRHIPVVEDTKPVGIISVRDILRYLCTHFADLPSS